jgi:hypothetical protein
MAVVALVPLFTWIGSSIGGAVLGGTAATATAAATGGFAIGAAIGTAAGVAAGAYVDSTFIYPMLMPSKDSRGPKLDDLPIQTASEGSPMHYCLGAENRIAGTVIWMSGIKAVKREESVEGGKGGGGGAKQTTYDYYLDIAIGVCEGPIDGIAKIWADSKLIYDESGGLRTGGDAVGYVVNSFQPQGDENINVTAGTGSFLPGDYVRFGGGGDVYKVTQKLTGTGTLVIESPGITTDIHTGDSVELVGTEDDGVKDPRVHLIRIYKGTANQVPDSIMEGYLGAGTVPGYRGTAYVVLKDMLLRDWGNRAPQFTFLTRAQVHESAAAAISNLLERAGLAFGLGEYNVDGVAHSVRGYAITGPTDTIKAIEPIMMAYDVLVQESNSSLRFFQRGAEDKINIDGNDVGAREKNESASRPFRMSDPSGFDLPRQVIVNFQDPTIEWQRGSQQYSRNDGNTNQTLTIDVPLVMHPSDAINLAATRLWRNYAERQQVEITLPPKYIHVEENDVIVIPYNGEVYEVRLNEVNIGQNFLVQAKGLLVGMEDADEAVECGQRFNEADPVQPTVMAQPTVLDTPSLREADNVEPGVYVTASVNSAVAGYQGSGVFASVDGVNYSQVASLGLSATAGYTLSALPSGTPGVWDTANTVDVDMIDGELSSVTEDRIYNGANRMWIGSELIAFRDAVLVGPRVYRLSNLLRGLRTTPTTDHLVNDKCVLISPDTVAFVPLNASSIGRYKYFKFVQQGQTIGATPAMMVNFMGGTMRQLAPIVYSITRDATTHDITANWWRRTRSHVGVWSPYKPLGADSERYDVDFIYSGAVVRTKQVTSPTVGYTGTEQTADGVPAGGTVTMRIYQINEQTGRGYNSEDVIS